MCLTNVSELCSLFVEVGECLGYGWTYVLEPCMAPESTRDSLRREGLNGIVDLLDSEGAIRGREMVQRILGEFK